MAVVPPVGRLGTCTGSAALWGSARGAQGPTHPSPRVKFSSPYRTRPCQLAQVRRFGRMPRLRSTTGDLAPYGIPHESRAEVGAAGQPRRSLNAAAAKTQSWLCGWLHSEPSYSAQTQRSNPAFSRGRLSAQNPHTVLSRICMKLDIKTVD